MRPLVFRWQTCPWDQSDASEWILDPQPTPLPPYALMRLTRETGGSYVVFDREKDRSEHQLTDFEKYLPDYRSEAEIRSEFSQYPLRRVLVDAVRETYYEHHRLPPRLDFMEFWYAPAEFRMKFAPVLATEHDYARELESRVERALGPFLAPEMDELYQKEPSAYWRAYYDLSKGLLLAASVRFREYRLACEWVARSLQPATNAVYFKPSNQLRSGDWGSLRQAEAQRCFDRCQEHSPGTPWADLAQQQRAHDLWFQPRSEVTSCTVGCSDSLRKTIAAEPLRHTEMLREGTHRMSRLRQPQMVFRQPSSSSWVRLLGRTKSWNCAAAGGIGHFDFHPQPAVGRVLKADHDRRSRRQAWGQVADRAAADRDAALWCGALALDDLHQDRLLVVPLRAENPPGRGRQGRVARNQNRRAFLPRQRVGAHHAQAVGIDVDHPERRRLASVLGQQQPGAQRRAVGHRLVGRHRGVGRLAGELPEHLRTIGMRVEPPTEQHPVDVVPRPIRPPRSVCRVVNRVRSSRSCVASSNCLRGDLRSLGQRPGIRRGPRPCVRAESVRLASSHSRHSLPADSDPRRGSKPCCADELLGHEVHQPLVPVVAAQPHVAVGGQGEELGAAISITVTSNVPPPRS